MSSPRVFISYSHDDVDHKRWILQFASRLRRSGIDVTLDQWDLEPGDDLPSFMERGLSDSDYVVIVCSERYVHKANAGEGGVGYEKMIVTSALIKNIDLKKFIPVVVNNDDRSVPTFLASRLYIDFSTADDYEMSFDSLLRTLHQSPLFEKPAIGSNPYAKDVNSEPNRANTVVNRIMKCLADYYEAGKMWVNQDQLREISKVSKIRFEHVLWDMVKKGLIRVSSDNAVCLEPEGKRYILDLELDSGHKDR